MVIPVLRVAKDFIHSVLPFELALERTGFQQAGKVILCRSELEDLSSSSAINDEHVAKVQGSSFLQP